MGVLLCKQLQQRSSERLRVVSHVKRCGRVEHEGRDAGLSVRLLHVFAVVSAQGRTIWMPLAHVHEVLIGPAGSEAAVLTHEDLGAALPVRVLLPHAMDLAQVRLQRAALRESLLAQLTPVRPDTCTQGCEGKKRRASSRNRSLEEIRV